MAEPTFSVTVSVEAWPEVVVGVNKDAWRLELWSFPRDTDTGVNSLTVHLPKDVDGLRTFAHKLLAAADEIAASVPAEQTEVGR